VYFAGLLRLIIIHGVSWGDFPRCRLWDLVLCVHGMGFWVISTRWGKTGGKENFQNIWIDEIFRGTIPSYYSTFHKFLFKCEAMS